jgi:tetratricopeptide (TPR) repeat protein/CHAT domain-containing protein
MKSRILCGFIGILIVLSSGVVLAQSENQVIKLTKEANIILDNAKSKDDYQQAAQKHEEALKIFERVKSDKGIGHCSNQLGLIQSRLGQYQKALDYFEQSLAITQKLGDTQGEGVTLNNMAEVYKSLQQHQMALEFYEKSLAIKQKLGDVKGEGVTLNAIGNVYYAWGQHQKSLEYYEKSLAIKQKLGDVKGEGVTLTGIGNVYSAPQHQKAVEQYEKSLAIKRKISDVKGEGFTLNAIGNVYYAWGQYPKSLEYYEKSLAIEQKIGDVKSEGITLNNMARVYESLSQHQKALEYYERSLAIEQKLEDVKGEGVTLNNIAGVYKSLGQYQKALEYYEKSLAMQKKIGVPYDGTEDAIGNVYLTMGDIQRAEPLLKRANRWVSLGRLALVKSDFNEAKSTFEIGLKRSLPNRIVDGLFAGHTGLGLSYEGLSQYDKAAEHFKDAMEVTEQIRDSLTPAQRSDFYDAQIVNIPRITPYQGLARVLLKSGKPEQSFKESEGTKARMFAESLSGRAQGVLPKVPKVFAGWPNHATLGAQLNHDLDRLMQYRQKAYESGSSKDINRWHRFIAASRATKKNFIDQVRELDPLYAASKYPQPMSLEHSALKEDEWTLEYEVTEPGICIYLAKGKKIVKGLFKPIAKKDVDELVRKFREPMELRSGDSAIEKLKTFDFASGKKLSDLLLGDILSDLTKDTPVIIVPDGSLGVVPFEMLVLNNAGKIVTEGEMPQTSGAEFFGDRNPISYYQSVTALTLARTLGKQKKPGEKTLAMVDPVFTLNDPRLLKYAKNERETLAASLPTKLLVPMEEQNSITFPRVKLTAQLGESLKNADPSRTDIYEGMEAQKTVILGKDLTPYNSLVFATHGYFGKDLPGIQEPVLILTLLGLPTGQDGFLRMSEVMCLNINCDIAALTACQSGLGRIISGEGAMGMGRAFQYAGAKSVLMSLWSVSESASVNLVENFFKHLREGKTKLESLKLARDEIRKAGYDHPFFWAAFILVGETQ